MINRDGLENSDHWETPKWLYSQLNHDNPLGIEQSLHAFFGKKRLEGEWFKLSYVDLNYIEEALGNG